MFRTLRGMTALLLALALAPGFVAFWRVARSEHEAGIASAREEIQRLALHAAEQQRRTVDAARGLLAAFAETGAVQERDGDACHRLAEALRARLPFISNLGAAAPDGRTFCHAVHVKPGISIADRLYFQRAISQQAFTFGEYQVSRAANLGAINFGYPAFRGGALSAVVFVGASTDYIAGQLASLGLPEGGAAYVTDAEGRVLAGTGVAPGTRLSGPFADWLRAGAAGIGELEGPSGEPMLFAQETLGLAGSPGLRIAVGLERSHAYGSADAAWRRAMAIFGAGVLAAGLALAFLADRLIVRRLQALGRAAKRIAHGDYAARTGVEQSPDELGRLARDFDEMACSLEAITRQHRLVLECAGDGILGLDLDGRITFANPAAERLLAIPAAGALGRPIHDFFPRHEPLAEGPTGCAICDALALGTVQGSGGVRITRQDGSAFTAECAATPTVERGRTVGGVLTLRDVTVRLKLEEDLRQSQKMEAVGQLAGGIAHDFNNLLTAIIGSGQLARGELAGHAASEDVEEILGAARRAADLTQRLLAFSRKTPARTDTVETGELLATTWIILRRLLGENIRLELERGDAPCPVRVDPALLEQAIINLVLNARDAMPRGGRIQLAVRPIAADDPSAWEDPGLPAGPLVELSVADDGIGMDAATRARAFEPFFTTKAPGKGTGLGLSTVYAFVKQAGGVVRIESEPGLGTTFRIYLPRAGGRLEAALAPTLPPRGAGELILVVEDDPGVRGVVDRVLGNAGYRVLLAAAPSDALAAVSSAGRPALLLTDVMLAEGSGPELAQELTALHPGLRVLFISGYTGDLLAERDVASAMIDLLPKPFSTEVLLARVRAALDGAPCIPPSLESAS